MAERLEDLLRACTVRVLGGPMPGAGFFVAPGKVLTCLHVIGDSPVLVVRWERDGRPAVDMPVSGRALVLADRGRPIPALERDYPDIAVLDVGVQDGHPCVGIDAEWPSHEDGFLVFGYPREGGAVQLTPARLTYRGTKGVLPTTYLDLASDTIKPGMSGAAVLNLRSGAVCGVVVASKHSAHPDGALAIPWSAINTDLSEVLAANRAFHLQDRRWNAAVAASRMAGTRPASPAAGRRSRRWTFGRIDNFVPPPDPVCGRIRQSLYQSKPAGVVVFSGRSGCGKTGLAGWAARDPEVQRHFDSTEIIEYSDDWPEASRGERAFEEFCDQIGATQGSFEEPDFDTNLAPGSTLLIFDDVRTPSDLRPFFGFFDRCTVLVTTQDSRILTELVTDGRPLMHFDLDSPAESEWVSTWVQSILTRSWPVGAAPGDLVEKCEGWALLAARVNRDVIHRAVFQPGLVGFNHAIRTAAAKLSDGSPDEFDASDIDRSFSVRASIRLTFQRIGNLPGPPSNPAARFKELGALPADVRVPIEVLDELWAPEEPGTARRFVERLADLSIVQLERPESGHYQRIRVRLHDSDRQYLRTQYPKRVYRAHRRLVKRADRGELSSPAVSGYWAKHRIWHLIGAKEYARLSLELADPESLVTAALTRGVRSVEYDLALVLAHCPAAELGEKASFLRHLQNRIRQSIDLLEKCQSRESFCPTLAARLRGEPGLGDFVAALGRHGGDPTILVKGPPHDMDDRRLLQRFPKRLAGVKTLSWLPAPDRIGIAYKDGSAHIWDPRTDRLDNNKLPCSPRPAVASWSQSGGLLALGFPDGTVTLWPSSCDASPESLQGQGVACVAWSKTGELAYAGWRGDLVSWSPGNGAHRWATNTGGTPVTALAWSADGSDLAFASAEGAVFILSDDGPMQVLAMHHGGAASLAWSSKGLLACAGWDGTVRVAELNGALLDAQPEQMDRRGPPTLAWDQDGDRLAIGGRDGAVSVWCASECRIVLKPEFQAVRALAWSPTAPLMAIGHDGGAIRIWRETDNVDLPTIRVQGVVIVGLAWSSREDHLVAAGSDGAVTIWAPFEGSNALRSAIRTERPTTVRCSPDGHAVATAEEAGAVRLWEVATDSAGSEPRTLMSHAAWKPAVGWAPTGASRIAAGGADGVVQEWSADMEWSGHVLHEHSAWVSGLAWSSNERLATVGRDWTVYIRHPSRPTYGFVAHEGGTIAMAWSPQGSLLATAGNDWLVRIWWSPDRVSSASPQEQWGLVAQFRAHLGGATAVEWAPGGRELATAGWDRSVRRWQLRLPARPTPVHQPTRVGWRLTDMWRTPASAVTALAWSPNGTSLVGADRRGRLHSWDCGNPRGTEMHSSHEGPVTALRWSRSANRILSTGTDGTLRMWTADGEECARVVFRTPLYSLDLHDDSGLIAVGGEYGATILQLRTATMME